MEFLLVILGYIFLGSVFIGILYAEYKDKNGNPRWVFFQDGQGEEWFAALPFVAMGWPFVLIYLIAEKATVKLLKLDRLEEKGDLPIPHKQRQ